MGRHPFREHPVSGILVAVVLVPALALIGGCARVHSANNAAAQRLEDRLLELPLPAPESILQLDLRGH